MIEKKEHFRKDNQYSWGKPIWSNEEFNRDKKKLTVKIHHMYQFAHTDQEPDAMLIGEQEVWLPGSFWQDQSSLSI